MNYIKEILRGVVIGIANVIPGVSGGTMAVSMGIYDKIIFAITNLKKDFKNSVKTLLPYIIGMLIGIVGLAFLIEMLFDKYKIPTVMAFLGLILGGLPPIVKKVENEKFKVTHLISFAIFVAIIVFPTLLTSTNNTMVEINFGIGSVVLMLVLGFVSAGTMVIPGVSGSMVLMMLGYYETIIQTINSFIKAVTSFDFGTVLSSIQILIPFGIGVIICIFVVSKIIEILLRKYPNTTYWGIIGLVVASPVAILYPTNFLEVGIGTILVSLVTFAAGFFTALKLSK